MLSVEISSPSATLPLFTNPYGFRLTEASSSTTTSLSLQTPNGVDHHHSTVNCPSTKSQSPNRNQLSPSETIDGNDDSKRAVAKKLIEQYFYQLSNGCGNPKCGNRNCASSGQVIALTPNQAAARAIQLYTQEAELCVVHPSKIARTQHQIDGASSTVGCEEHRALNAGAAAKDCEMIDECNVVVADMNGGDTRWEFFVEWLFFNLGFIF